MKVIIKKREKNIMPVMGIEPTAQTAYDCKLSVLTTMLERMLFLLRVTINTF